MTTRDKEYLGDAVYAEWEEFQFESETATGRWRHTGFAQLILTTGDGQGMRIVLEPEVLMRLEAYLEARRDEIKRKESTNEPDHGEALQDDVSPEAVS